MELESAGYELTDLNDSNMSHDYSYNYIYKEMNSN